MANKSAHLYRLPLDSYIIWSYSIRMNEEKSQLIRDLQAYGVRVYDPGDWTIEELIEAIDTEKQML